MASLPSQPAIERDPRAKPAAGSPPPFRRALIVANPIAGRGRGERAGRALREALDRAGIGASLHLTRGRGDASATVRAQAELFDLIVSVGGDGSLREVLDGLGDCDVPILVAPIGTANVLALDLRLPRDVEGQVALARRARTTRIDVASVNGHLSFLVTGVGFDGHAVREVERRRSGPITKWSYVAAILRAMRGYRAPRLRVRIDGEPLDGVFGLVLIANIVHYGGVIRLSADIRRDDGRFEAFLMRRASLPALFAAGARGIASRFGGGSVDVRSCRRVEVESDLPVPYQVDGDFRGDTPVDLQVLARQHRILVP